MKKINFFVITMIVLLYACNSKQNKENATTTAVKENTVDNTATPAATPATTAAASWIDDFRTLRDAIYNKQKEVVAGYFNFPITQNNEALWSMCNIEGGAGSQPFTKADFIKYFDKIFNPEFIATLQKIKSEDLYKKGNSTTENIKGKDVESSMQASFNKANNSLQLQLNQEFYVEDGTGGESSTIMDFSIQNNKIKFAGVNIAG